MAFGNCEGVSEQSPIYTDALKSNPSPPKPGKWFEGFFLTCRSAGIPRFQNKPLPEHSFKRQAWEFRQKLIFPSKLTESHSWKREQTTPSTSATPASIPPERAPYCHFSLEAQTWANHNSWVFLGKACTSTARCISSLSSTMTSPSRTV